VRRGIVGGAVVIVQVALSLVLMVGAGLFLRSFAALAYRDLGFDRQRVLVAVVETGDNRTLDKLSVAEQVRQAVTASPPRRRCA
jgi:hypothetical protein